MIINFPDSGWLRTNYPLTQEASLVLIRLEKLSKKQCTCQGYDINKCNVCEAKNILDIIIRNLSYSYVKKILDE